MVKLKKKKCFRHQMCLHSLTARSLLRCRFTLTGGEIDEPVGDGDRGHWKRSGGEDVPEGKPLVVRPACMTGVRTSIANFKALCARTKL